MFYPVEHAIGNAPNRKTTKTKKMKTKILSLATAVMAIAVGAPAAFARPDFPVKRLTSGAPARSGDRMPDHCSGMSCCTTKWVSNTAALGGRGSHSSLKKVRACEKSCTLSAKEKHEVCRKGTRA